MRGEKGTGYSSAFGSSGPSPHARGKRHLRPRPSSSMRSIPACAGKTGSRPSATASTPVHPRMRGENFPPAYSAPRVYGPSPHARGKRTSIIPPPLAATVHPRMRGENDLVWNGSDLLYGPSPHARGKRSVDAAPLRPCPVHPRMRGENRRPEGRAPEGLGPSPHARGKRKGPSGSGCGASVHPRMRGENGLVAAANAAPRRSIPACAGKTMKSPVCAIAMVGPSPHARGKLEDVDPLVPRVRSIPACAGKTGAPTL